MSKHFELFDIVAPDVGSIQLSSNMAARPKVERSLLRYSGMWRVELERMVVRLYLGDASPKPQIVVFLGLEAENGSNNVCTYCSDLLASRMSGPICLVEANLALISLQQKLQGPNCIGLGNLLANPNLDLKRAVSQVSASNLWILSSGFSFPAGELLSHSERLLDRMNELRRCFDFTLIDAPPGRSSRDALTLAQLADGAVMVLPSSGGRRESARRFKQELDDAGVTIFGAVLADQESVRNQFRDE